MRYISDVLPFNSPPEHTTYLPQTKGLVALKLTLEASSDEMISTSSLRELGFKNVSELFDEKEEI